MIKGVILGAGKGTRLRPITYEIPKVMLPVIGVSVFEHIAMLMYCAGITNILYNCYKEPFKELGMDKLGLVKYHPYIEQKLCGSAGAIKRMEKELDDVFVLIYGDVISETNLPDMIDYHLQHGGIATVGVTRVPNPKEKGIINARKDGLITDFVEKPQKPTSNLANSAIYVFDPKVFKYIPKHRFFDIGKDLMPILIKNEKCYAYHIKEFLIDIGDFESYEKAIKHYRRVL